MALWGRIKTITLSSGKYKFITDRNLSVKVNDKFWVYNKNNKPIQFSILYNTFDSDEIWVNSTTDLGNSVDGYLVYPNAVFAINPRYFKIESIREMDKGSKFEITAVQADPEKYTFIDQN